MSFKILFTKRSLNFMPLALLQEASVSPLSTSVAVWSKMLPVSQKTTKYCCVALSKFLTKHWSHSAGMSQRNTYGMDKILQRYTKDATLRPLISSHQCYSSLIPGEIVWWQKRILHHSTWQLYRYILGWNFTDIKLTIFGICCTFILNQTYICWVNAVI